jgi:nicotinamide N-methyltransferase
VPKLARMRETMKRIDEERAEMVAEIEAQIERALASMAVDVEEPDYGNMSFPPGSGMSAARAASGRSWRARDMIRDGSVHSESRLHSEVSCVV